MMFGGLNGFLVAKYDMHPFIATLATQVIIYGACSLYFDMPPNNSQPIGGVRPDFALLGQFKFAEKAFGTKFPGISILVPIALIVLVVIWFVLNKTVFGKNVYAIGGNREAAVVSGVNVFKTIMGIFILASALYGVGGVLDLNGDGIGVPVAGGVAGLRRHSRDIQGVGIGISILRHPARQVGFRDGLFATGDVQFKLSAAVLYIQVVCRPAESDVLAVPAAIGLVQAACGLVQFDGRGR